MGVIPKTLIISQKIPSTSGLVNANTMTAGNGVSLGTSFSNWCYLKEQWFAFLQTPCRQTRRKDFFCFFLSFSVLFFPGPIWLKHYLYVKRTEKVEPVRLGSNVLFYVSNLMIGFVQNLEVLKKVWNLPSSFPDLKKVWKNGKKVLTFFSKPQQVLYKCFFFSFW